MEAIEQIEYKNKIIELHYDQDSESPREWDNLGTMVCFHRRYNLGDKHNYSDPEELQEYIKSQGDNLIILPLYLYDHGGITISTSSFSCPWDSGQVGFILVTKEQIRKEFSVKKVTKKLIEQTIKILKAEVETYDQYLRGEIYGYNVEETGDSCWGFYGRDDAINEAKSCIDYTVNQERKERQEKLKGMIKNHVPLQYRHAS